MYKKNLLVLSFLFLISWIGVYAQSSGMNMLGNADINGQNYNDIWGYVDASGNEYAIIGSGTHVYFYNVTNPSSPTLVNSFSNGSRPGLVMQNTVWRDFKTYDHYAYAVSDNTTEGLLIFDMQYLPDSVSFVVQNKAFFTKSHNIFIDTSSARLYAVATNTERDGMVVLDLSNTPASPTLLASIPMGTGAYAHDVYVINDTAYCSHEYRGLYVWDFSGSKVTAPDSLTSYGTGGYNHSSWRTPDGNHVVYAEEVPQGKKLRLIDVSDMTNVNLTATFHFPLIPGLNNTPHNPFIKDSLLFVSYYEDGVQVILIDNPNSPALAAYYDTYPGNTVYNGYFGCWGVYPFLPSGNIIASDRSTGLYILELLSPVLPVELAAFEATLDEGIVNLKWQTLLEKRFSHFEVEYSRNGLRFDKFADVPSLSNGDAYLPQFYEVNHVPENGSIHYYRLKIVDKDGSFIHSSIKTIVTEVNYENFKQHVYPTILTSNTPYIQLETGAASGLAEIIVFDQQGKRVFAKELYLQPGDKSSILTSSWANAAGIYFVKVQTNLDMTLHRIVVQQ